MASAPKLKLEAPATPREPHPKPLQSPLSGSEYVARLNRLDLSGNKSSSSSSWPPPISGHDLMAIFPTAPPSSTVCCNDIFNKQARAYLSGSRESTAPAQGDAPNPRPNWTAPGGARSEQSQSHSRANGLDALAEQACLESSSLRTPPDRPGGGSRNADRSEQDAEGGSSRQPRGRHSKAQRDGGLPRDATPDRRTTTPRPSSSSQADSATPLFTRRPLERTSYPRFVPQ